MRTLFVSDFDRTLYVNGDISPRNLLALKKWRQAGNLFVIATGREEKILRELLCSYQTAADYLICNNGARIVEWNGRVLFEQTIADDTAWHIIEKLLQEYHTAVDVTQRNGRIQVTDRADAAPSDCIYHGIHIFKTWEVFKHSLSDVLQIHIRFADREQTKRAADRINLCYCGAETFANEWNLDIVQRGINKAEGIETLMKVIKWEEQVAVIGDSFNDLCMIERFGGYTLETADREVQRKAADVCMDVAECMEQLY